MLRDRVGSSLNSLSLAGAVWIEPAGWVVSWLDSLWLGIGALLGVLTSRLIAHPRRNLGLVPIGWTGLLGLVIWVIANWPITGSFSFLFLAFVGYFLSLALQPLGVNRLSGRQLKYHYRSDPFCAVLLVLSLAIPSIFVASLWNPIAISNIAPGMLLGVGLTGFLLAWVVLYPQTIELIVAGIMLPFYRVHLHGPGRNCIPQDGPLLIVSNHASYLDPFWIGKVLPCHVRPLMTAAFYDRPLIRWLMVHVVEAIRLKSGQYRARLDGRPEATSLLDRVPELKTAVKALQDGACLLVFPEGKLRRTEPTLLSPFGQGVWHILRQHPETPVVTVWIEGSWGSWASYYGGPPLQNKKLDRARRIDVVVSEPKPIPTAFLAGHRETRAELTRRVLALRQELGLPQSRYPLPPAPHPEDRDAG